MHRMFPTWIQSLVATTDVEKPQVAAWNEACDRFVNTASAGDIANLVKLAWGRGTREFEQRWRQHMQAADELFPMRGGDNKVMTLAAAAVLLASESDAGADMALVARRCATVLDWSPVIDDLLLSASDLSEAAADRRVVPEWPRTRNLSVSTTAANATLGQFAQSGTGISHELIKQVVANIAQSAAETVARAETRIKRAVAAREKPFLEQSDVLIWLLSGHSEHLNTACDVSPLSAAFDAAIELDRLSHFALGRGDALSLIDFKVRSAAKKAKPANLDLMLANGSVLDRVRDLTPILSDIATFAEDGTNATALGMRLHGELNLVRLLKDDD